MKALVLSGGGSKGAFEVGVIKALYEQGYTYDIFAGTSVGALNSAILAQHDDFKKLEDLWLNKIKSNKNIWKHNLLFKVKLVVGSIILFTFPSLLLFQYLYNSLILSGVISLLSTSAVIGSFYFLSKVKSIYTSSPLYKLLINNFNPKLLKKKLIVGAVALNDGEYRQVNGTDPKIIDWIMASSAFPAFFPTVEIDGKRWSDGSIIDIAPIRAAVEAGATEIDVVLTHSPTTIDIYKDFGFLNDFLRTIDLMWWEILKNDIAPLIDINIRIFYPEEPLNHNALDFNPEQILKDYNLGIDSCVKQLKNYKP